MSKVMDDKQMLAIMDLLETTCIYCPYYFSHFLALRIVQLSISHGASVNTAYGFAYYSCILCHLGDLCNASKYAKFALDIMQRMQARQKYCR
eukprot:10154249-Ditylum_brightwellii.AAC.1